MQVYILDENKKTGWTGVTLEDDFTFKYIGLNHDKTAIEIVKVGAITDSRFQILFEIALNHLSRGQYRDAVVTAQAALERYREFIIRASTVKDGTHSGFNELWKIMKKQSERQIGAYHATIFGHTGAVGQDLSNRLISFRNEIVHNGILPEKESTTDYCTAVLEIMASGVCIFKNDHLDTLSTTAMHEQEARLPKNVDYRLTINPIVNFNMNDNDNYREILLYHLEKLKLQRFERIAWPNYSWII